MIEKNELLWKVKGATLSDKSACKEYKISREEIIQGINEGKLQYRVNYVYGNPWFRLLRQELEKFIAELHGNNHLQVTKLKTELKQIEHELKKIQSQTIALEMRKAQINADLEALKEIK